jgi:hypothetical protein
MRKLELRLMVLALSGLAAVMAAGPAFAQHGAGNKVFLKLPRPQGDDQGHYVPAMKDGIASVIGFASAPGGVASVTANGAFAWAPGGVASVTANGVFASARGGVPRVRANGVFASARGGAASVTVNGVVAVNGVSAGNGVVAKLGEWYREHVGKAPSGLRGVYWADGRYGLGIVGDRHTLGFGWRSSW